MGTVYIYNITNIHQLQYGSWIATMEYLWDAKGVFMGI